MCISLIVGVYIYSGRFCNGVFMANVDWDNISKHAIQFIQDYFGSFETKTTH
jgi:hypothetical protein